MKKVLLFLVAIIMVQFTASAEAIVVATDDCGSATDLSSLLGGTIDMPMNSPMYSNVGATVSSLDSTLTGYECFGENDGVMFTPSLENTQWATFTGDGGLYEITTTDCGGTVTDYVDGGDTQMVIYTGADCNNLTPSACNEDIAGTPQAGPYPAGLNFQTTAGVKYYILIDGFDGADGEYCIQFTQLNAIANAECADATDLDLLLAGDVGAVISSPIQTNVGAGSSASDPPVAVATCFGENDGVMFTPSLDNTVWYSFTGDGGLYSILTTDCDGTVADYIDNGDTQLLIFTGSCGDLTPVACNDDVAGTPQGGPFPAGLDFQTEAGVTYYMLIDGFGVSDGEFCIQFTEIPIITCDDIAVGMANLTNTVVCADSATALSITDGTVVPITSDVDFFMWVVSTEDISGSVDPFGDASVTANFGLQSAPSAGTLTNNAMLGIAPGSYFITPVVSGGGVDTDGTLDGLDYTNGCILAGTSVPLVLVPGGLADLTATSSFEDEVMPPGNNGTASVEVTGGTGVYTYMWSNGETTDSISGLPAGTYTVTIEDETSCVAGSVVDVTVGNIVSVDELEFQQAIQIQPNPAQQQTTVQYNFSEALDLEVTLTNTLGQVISNRMINGAQNGNVDLDLTKFANGIYFVNITDGEHQLTRRLVISK